MPPAPPLLPRPWPRGCGPLGDASLRVRLVVPQGPAGHETLTGYTDITTLARQGARRAGRGRPDGRPRLMRMLRVTRAADWDVLERLVSGSEVGESSGSDWRALAPLPAGHAGCD